MRSLLKGPIPAFAACFFLLCLAYAGHTGFVPGVVSPATPSYPLARLFQTIADRSGPVAGIPADLLLTLALQSIGAAFLYLTFLAWTGNRIVSFLGAMIGGTHPVLAGHFLSPDRLLHAAPVPFLALALYFRESAWMKFRLGASVLPKEAIALCMFGAALVSGPSALVGPLLLVLAESTFHVREPTGIRRESFAVAVLWVVLAFGLWHFDRPHEWMPSGTLQDSAERGVRIALVPISGSLASIIAAALALGGLAAWALGRRTLQSAPKWMMVFLGFGLVWALATEIPTLLGIVPKALGGSLFAAFGVGLFLPSLGWRVWLRLVPETSVAARPVENGRAVPALPSVPESGPLAFPIRASNEALPHALTASQVRASVEAAVAAAVETAVAAAARSLRGGAVASATSGMPGAAYAREWDLYEAKWAENAGALGHKVLGQEWTDRQLEISLFENYCRPYLAQGATILEIGQGGGKFTSMMAPLVRRVVCLDVSINMLRRARQDLNAPRNVSFVLSDGRGLQCLVPGSIDFAFSYDVFVHLDQEDAYLYLHDLRAVLRPGGRAVISFANLLDPLGFRHFEALAAAHKSGGRNPGRINFLSPEIVKTMAKAAGLKVTSVHLAANDRDMLIVFERAP